MKKQTYFSAFTLFIFTLSVVSLFGEQEKRNVSEKTQLPADAIMLPSGADSLDCVADFSFSSDDLSVAFENLSQGTDLTYFWDFGDGSTSTEENPVYTYSEPGIYGVCLSVFSEDPQCTDTYCLDIQVGPETCQAMFDFFAVDYLVYFGDESQGNIDTWAWDFGDGNTSSLQSPNHTYASPGPFEVCLTVSNSQNPDCSDTFCQIIILDASDCNAYWEYEADDLTVTFNNMSAGENLSYLWYFGDENSSVLENPVHTYSEPGIYGVCLLIEDTETGCQDSFCLDILVGTIPCEANFDYFVLADSLGVNTVYFTNLSTGDFTQTFWDFGDGNTSTQNSPIHTYDSTGVFPVCLTITNPDNPDCADTFCLDVVIDSIPCEAQFVYVVNGLTVDFLSQSTGSDPYHYWFFGDGNASDQINPQHTYASAGIYDVCLAIYDEIQFCYDYTCTQVAVGNPECEADFSFFQSGENTIQFFNQSNIQPDSLIWDFGDGNFSGQFSPVHTYAEPGSYNVCLTIFSDAFECEDQICQDVTVGEMQCMADFGFSVEDQTVTFENLSTGSPSTEYIWEFGDDNYSTETNPVHTYAEPGMYDVCLILSDPETGCSDFACQMVFVGDSSLSFNAYFTYEMKSSASAQFIESSLGSAVNYQWDLGDGTTSLEQHPDHAYQQPGNYQVCLTVYDLLTGEPSTFCREIEIEEITSAGNISATSESFTIWPNPVNHEMNISFEIPYREEVNITMYNLAGQKVADLQPEPYSAGYHSLNIDASAFEEGLYFIRFEAADRVETRKVVISR